MLLAISYTKSLTTVHTFDKAPYISRRHTGSSRLYKTTSPAAVLESAATAPKSAHNLRGDWEGKV